jgi:VIT1/CCC1 family predicted Fe2+/Mn2+ transporter
MTQAYEVGPAAEDAEEKLEARADERAIGEVITGIWEKAETLVRQEMRLGIAEAEEKVDLLKLELDERLAKLKLELTAKTVGGAVAIGGALSLVACIVLLLSKVMAPWIAALLTGVIFVGTGVALLRRKVQLPPPPSAANLIPQRTIASIQADTQAIEEASHGTATHL